MLGEVPHFLLREQVGNPHFFHKSSIAAHGKRKTTRGSPKNSEASGNGLELGGLRSVDAWEEAVFPNATRLTRKLMEQIKDFVPVIWRKHLLCFFCCSCLTSSYTHEMKIQAIDWIASKSCCEYVFYYLKLCNLMKCMMFSLSLRRKFQRFYSILHTLN